MTTSPVDVDSLPLTQYLLLEVLAAMYRTGVVLCPLPGRLEPAASALGALGLVEQVPGAVPETIQAQLTETGRAVILRDDYRPPLDLAHDLLADVVVKATEYGIQDGAFVANYILPTGPIHRAIPYLDGHGINVRPGFDGRTNTSSEGAAA